MSWRIIDTYNSFYTQIANLVYFCMMSVPRFLRNREHLAFWTQEPFTTREATIPLTALAKFRKQNVELIIWLYPCVLSHIEFSSMHRWQVPLCKVTLNFSVHTPWFGATHFPLYRIYCSRINISQHPPQSQTCQICLWLQSIILYNRTSTNWDGVLWVAVAEL